MALKLHELLAQALEHMDAFVAMGNVVRMETWLGSLSDSSSTCRGCMAGAYIYVKAGLSPELKSSCTGEFWQRFDQAFDQAGVETAILDDLREGQVEVAYNRLRGRGLSVQVSPVPDRSVTQYKDDPRSWRADMEQLVSDLKHYDL